MDGVHSLKTFRLLVLIFFVLLISIFSEVKSRPTISPDPNVQQIQDNANEDQENYDMDEETWISINRTQETIKTLRNLIQGKIRELSNSLSLAKINSTVVKNYAKSINWGDAVRNTTGLKPEIILLIILLIVFAPTIIAYIVISIMKKSLKAGLSVICCFFRPCCKCSTEK